LFKKIEKYLTQRRKDAKIKAQESARFFKLYRGKKQDKQDKFKKNILFTLFILLLILFSLCALHSL